jgi:hypothetical protein
MQSVSGADAHEAVCRSEGAQMRIVSDTRS